MEEDLKVARMAAQKEGGSTWGLVEQYLGRVGLGEAWVRQG